MIDVDPEHESVEAFVEYLMDDERDTFTADDLNQLACATKRSNHKVRAELESYGLRLARREKARRVRGVTSNPHDRWYGPGAERTFGGSGWEQINGFGGQDG